MLVVWAIVVGFEDEHVTCVVLLVVGRIVERVVGLVA